MKRPFLAAVLAAAGLVVCACGGSASPPRPTVTITVTGTPSPSATTEPATNAPVTSPTAAAAAACLTRYLNGSVGQTQGTAGAVEVTIVFKNVDNVPCTLYGYPGVALATGTPVTDVGEPSSENPSTPRELVTLAPGGYANATLQIADAGNFPASTCTQVTTNWLAVIPPNQTVPINIAYNSTACKGTASLLTVTAVRPGSGG